MAKEKDTALAATKKAAVAPPTELAQQLIADVGQGFENMGRDDIALPFIGLIQSMSPQRKRTDPKYIPGAEEGRWFNSVTNELYPAEGVRIIPVHYEKVYNEWIPRSVGGGFVATYKSREEALEGKRMDPVGHSEGQPVYTDIVDTAVHYVLAQSANGDWQPAILSLKSTGLKYSRQLNGQLQLLKLDVDGNKITPPMFASVYVLSSMEVSNDQGTFFVPQFTREGWVWDVADLGVYAEAKAFREVVTSGQARVDFEKAAEAETPAPVDTDEPPAF